MLIHTFIVRLWLPCLDLTGRCKKKEDFDIYIYQQNIFIMMFQVFFNIRNTYWISIPQSLMSVIMIQISYITQESDDCRTKTYVQIINSHRGFFIFNFVYCIMLITFLQALFMFYYNNTLRALNQQLVLEDQISHLIANLDAGVICKTDDGVSFYNDFGFNVLKNISILLKK